MSRASIAFVPRTQQVLELDSGSPFSQRALELSLINICKNGNMTQILTFSGVRMTTGNDRMCTGSKSSE